MKLQAKLISIIFISLTIFSTALLLTVKTFLLKDFQQLESTDIEKNTERLRKAIEEEFNALSINNQDWSNWDDMYQFMADRNASFRKANLTTNSLQSLKTNLMLLLDVNGKMVEALQLKSDLSEQVPLTKQLLQLLVPGSPYLKHKNESDQHQGFVMLPEGPLLLVSQPIVSTVGRGPIRGTLFFGRYLNDSRLEKVSRMLGLSLSLVYPNGNRTELPEDREAIEILKSNTDTAWNKQSDKETFIYVPFKDFRAERGPIIKVELPRDIWRQGLKMVETLLLALIIPGVLLAIVLIFALKAFIIDRIVKVSTEMDQIAKKENSVWPRIEDCSARDEITMLIRTANRMISRVEKQQSMLTSAARMSALGEMATGIAQEISIPLTAILNNVESLRKLVPNDHIVVEKMAPRFQKIDETGKRLFKIIRGLSFFTQSDASAPMKTVKLKTIVDNTLEFCSEKFKLRGITLTISDIPEDVTIHCRPTEISQVLLNLLSNSFDAVVNLPKRWVNVKLTRSSKALQLIVSDSGAGISPEVADKIFYPFFTTKSAGKSSGLGLAISKGIIEKHGGSLFLDKSRPNTEFVIMLPLTAQG